MACRLQYLLSKHVRGGHGAVDLESVYDRMSVTRCTEDPCSRCRCL